MAECTETDEDSSGWLEDINGLDYGRAGWVLARTRRGRPPFAHIENERLVGHTTLRKDAAHCDEPGWYYRRVFSVARWDRDSDPTGVYKRRCPMEAVDPRTVAPTVSGEKTERCWNGK